MKKLLLIVVSAAMLFVACGGTKLISLARPTFDKHYMSKETTEALAQKPPRAMSLALVKRQPPGSSCPGSGQVLYVGAHAVSAGRKIR